MPRRHVAPTLKLALSPTQIVTACGVSFHAVKQGIEDGSLPVHDINGKRRIWCGDVEIWFKSHPLARKARA
jgi:hypothetical protein